MIHFSLDTLHREDYGSSPGHPSYLLTPPDTVMLGERVVEVQIIEEQVAVTQAHLDAFARFLNDYASVEAAIARAIKERYESKEGDIIEWLEEILVPAYWSMLFPGCKSPADVSADQYFQALTLVSIRFYSEPKPEDEEIVSDYRFCVPESALLPEDTTRFQRYLDKADLTDQVFAAKVMLDGRLLGVDLES
jgi:hypothetical protein